MKKKILYVSGTYCPAHGGAEVSMHTFLKMSLDTFDVLVATDLSNSPNVRTQGHYENVPVNHITHHDRINSISHLCTTYNPDVVITQLMWSDVALAVAKELSIPSIYRLCKLPTEIDLRAGSQYEPTEIFGVSQATKDFSKERWNRESHIICPPIDKTSVQGTITNHWDCKYITIFNPVKKKGGFVFEQTAKALPSLQFAYVPGWDILRSGNKFDKTKIERLCLSIDGKYDGRIPTEPSFEGLANVTRISPTRQVSTIYDQIRLLLMPSQWEEAFGRVAVEAMMNSIPVIGSSVGGLQDLVSQGGVVVNDFANPKSWKDAIESILIKSRYDIFSQRAREFTQKEYSIDKNVIMFKELVLSASHRKKYF